MSKRSPPNAGLTEVGQIAVAVEDVERATAFYRDVLGVPFLFDAPGLAFFDLGGIRLMLSRPEGVGPSASVLYFRATDIQASYERLLGHGVEFREGHRMWFVGPKATSCPWPSSTTPRGTSWPSCKKQAASDGLQ